jgi:hypothetical protein
LNRSGVENKNAHAGCVGRFGLQNYTEKTFNNYICIHLTLFGYLPTVKTTARTFQIFKSIQRVPVGMQIPRDNGRIKQQLQHNTIMQKQDAKH